MRALVMFALAICLALAGQPSVLGAGPPQTTAWLAYWGLEGSEGEAEMLRKAGGTLSYFAAYYGASDNLRLHPEEFERFLGFRERGLADKALLCVVNDSQNDGGSYVLKDAALVARLLADEEAMQRHAAELAELAVLHEFDGLDMDFENLGAGRELWRRYADFLGILYRELSARGLALRVTLEPGAVEKAAWPKGPDYAVMLYNLFGPHSKPGPKADPAFIRATLKKALKALGPGVQAALATGGFAWDGDGKAVTLTEAEALERLMASGSRASRDENSGARHFTYREKSGQTLQVWFADGQTLAMWARVCREAGVSSLALWRLGGNRASSLQAFFDEASLQ